MPEKLKKVFESCMKSKTYANKSPKERESICRATAVKVTKQKWVKHSVTNEPQLVEEFSINTDNYHVKEIKLSENGNIKVTAISITDDHEDADNIRKFHKLKIGNKIIWDHNHPLDEKEINGVKRRYPVFGRITDSYLEKVKNDDGKPVLANIIKYDLFGYTPAQVAFQEFVKDRYESGDPFGMSDQYIRYLNKDNQVMFIHNEESSITPAPICEICKIVDIEYSKKGEDIMSEQNSGSEITKVEAEKKELSKTKDNEDARYSVEVLEETILKQNSAIKDLNTKIKNFEETILSKNSTINELQVKLSKTEKHIDFLENKKPILLKIEEFLGGKYTNNETIKKHYESMTVDQLKIEVELLSKTQESISSVPVKNEPAPGKIEPDEKVLPQVVQMKNTFKQLMEQKEKDSINYIISKK